LKQLTLESGASSFDYGSEPWCSTKTRNSFSHLNSYYYSRNILPFSYFVQSVSQNMMLTPLNVAAHTIN